LRQIHREKIEKAAESADSMWKVAKWARSRKTQTPNITPEFRDPATGRRAASPEEKAKLLKETFFPIPPEANTDDITHQTYTNQRKMPPIITGEIEEAVKEAAPLKAAGPDGIPNKVIQAALPQIKIHL
jgi:hypothetical protein